MSSGRYGSLLKFSSGGLRRGRWRGRGLRRRGGLGRGFRGRTRGWRLRGSLLGQTGLLGRHGRRGGRCLGGRRGRGRGSCCVRGRGCGGGRLRRAGGRGGRRRQSTRMMWCSGRSLGKRRAGVWRGALLSAGSSEALEGGRRQLGPGLRTAFGET